MDVLTFVTEIVKALAWPLVALVIAVIFRAELRSLSHRIKKGKVGPAEFEFEEAVAALRERVGRAAAHQVEPDPTLINRASHDPRAVILNSWLQVQAVVENIVAKHATPEDLREPRSTKLRVLHRLLRDKREYIDMYNDLRTLRDQAVHEIDFSPRPASVIEYAELANELLGVLRRYGDAESISEG